MSSPVASDGPRARISTPVDDGADDGEERTSETRRRVEGELGTVAGRYKLLSRIAEGGMGVVFKAEHVLSRKKLAVKILHPHLCHGRQAVERFRREVSAAAEIDHPGIVQVFDAGVDTDGSFYMAMELLEGESLGNRTRRHWPGTRSAVELIIGMCEPLAKAHEKGFVHRDLKPDNVFVARDHTGHETVKLLDFGLVREVTRRGPTMSGITFGTPEYMAPEQAMSAKKAGVTADVWSVGVMLYELLAGQHPFTGETANAVMANAIKDPHPPLAEVAPHVPAELATIVESCLAKDPARRPSDAGTLGAMLRALTERIELDEQGPANPVLSSHDDDEDGGEGEDGRPLDDDEHALLSAPAPLPLALRGGPTTDVGPRSARTGSFTRYAGWVAVTAGALGLVGVIVWALSQREHASMTATALPGSDPAVVTPAALAEPPAGPEEGTPAPEEPRGPAATPPVAVEPGAETAEAEPSEAEPGAPERAAAPTRSTRARRESSDGDGSALAEAQACMQRGDTRCAVNALQNARGAAEMALLIDVYHVQGRASDARAVMQRYLRRYPRGRQAETYRRQLGLAGQ